MTIFLGLELALDLHKQIFLAIEALSKIDIFSLT